MTAMQYQVSAWTKLQRKGLKKGRPSMHTFISPPESVLTLLQEAELPLVSADMRDLEKEFVSSRNAGNTCK